jgi:hypothetical protein
MYSLQGKQFYSFEALVKWVTDNYGIAAVGGEYFTEEERQEFTNDLDNFLDQMNCEEYIGDFDRFAAGERYERFDV